MKEIRRILTAVDGSDSAQLAVEASLQLASRCGAAVEFVYVVNLNGAFGGYPLPENTTFSSVLEGVLGAGKAVLEHVLDQAPEALETRGHCVDGDPGKTIVELAEKEGCDLIVAGSRGLGVLKGALLGSVSQYLVENAKCPVLVIKAGAQQEESTMGDFKTILVPVDGSESSERAIEHAVVLAQICGAKLKFLYVANINQLAINACLSDAILEAVTKAGSVILDRALEKVPEGIEAESFAETGSPAVVIMEFAEAEHADLVIMGSRGLGVVKGVLLGSVSQHLVERAKCPVMVVK